MLHNLASDEHLSDCGRVRWIEEAEPYLPGAIIILKYAQLNIFCLYIARLRSADPQLVRCWGELYGGGEPHVPGAIVISK